MQGQYLVGEARDSETIQVMSRAISAWSSLLSLKVTQGDALYDGVRTCYGCSIGGPSTLCFGKHQAELRPGDAIVVPPAVRVAARPPAELFWACYEGLAPEHLRGPLGQKNGFEHFAWSPPAADPSRGMIREVVPLNDLRHRLHYHFLETRSNEPRVHSDMVQLVYVLHGEGELRVGPSAGELNRVPVRPGMLVAIGPALYQLASDGLGLCVWFLTSEMGHRRRVREAAGS